MSDRLPIANRSKVAGLPWTLLIVLLVVLGITTAASAAPIAGSDDTVPTSEKGLPTSPGEAATTQALPLTGLDPNSTVVEFAIIPEAEGPQTIVVLRRQGGRKVCVNLKSTDVIVRSYQKLGEEPFAPTIPGEIHGQTSGDSGILIGFNETKVFIRPDTPEDLFANADECFNTEGAEACFVPEQDDCDEILDEGEFACVTATISSEDCSITELTDLIREMRILAALNQPPGEATLVTEAGITGAPEITVSPQAPGGQIPSGVVAAGPTAEGLSAGGGGGGEIIVPDVIGKTVSDALAIMSNARVTVGTVEIGLQTSLLDFDFIHSANAAANIECSLPPEECPNANVNYQSERLVPWSGNPILIRASASAVPEPASFYLFAIGVALVAIIAWLRRQAV